MTSSKAVLLGSIFCLQASAQVQINVQLPSITFGAPPPLVVVQPGIQVVEDNDDEVFFVSDAYWVRRGPRWYRTRDYRGGWVVVDDSGVPASLVRLPPGQYRRYRRGKTVVVDTPGPGKVKFQKEKKGKHKD